MQDSNNISFILNGGGGSSGLKVLARVFLYVFNMSTPLTSRSQAQVHKDSSLRADNKRRRTVFRSVLDTPYTPKWPFIPQEIQNQVLDALCDILTPLGEYNRALKSVRSLKHKEKQQSRKIEKAHFKDAISSSSSASTLMEVDSFSSKPLPSVPVIRPYITTGINAITKYLERTIQSMEQQPAFEIIFVCKADIAPPHLCAHLPLMVGLFNTKENGKRKLVLCPLAKGAQERLSVILGRGRCSAVAFQGLPEKSEKYQGLLDLLDSYCQIATAPWLQNAIVNSAQLGSAKISFLPTNVKTLQTSTPLDKKGPSKTSKLKRKSTSKSIIDGGENEF